MSQVPAVRRGGKPRSIGANERQQASRDRRKLIKLFRRKMIRGLSAVVGMHDRAIEACGAIIANPAHPDHAQMVRFVIQLHQDAQRELWDRTGLTRHLKIDGDGDVAVLPAAMLERAVQAAAAQVAADPARGAVEAVDAEFELVPPPEGGTAH